MPVGGHRCRRRKQLTVQHSSAAAYAATSAWLKDGREMTPAVYSRDIGDEAARVAWRGWRQKKEAGWDPASVGRSFGRAAQRDQNRACRPNRIIRPSRIRSGLPSAGPNATVW